MPKRAKEQQVDQQPEQAEDRTVEKRTPQLTVAISDDALLKFWDKALPDVVKVQADLLHTDASLAEVRKQIGRLTEEHKRLLSLISRAEDEALTRMLDAANSWGIYEKMGTEYREKLRMKQIPQLLRKKEPTYAKNEQALEKVMKLWEEAVTGEKRLMGERDVLELNLMELQDAK